MHPKPFSFPLNLEPAQRLGFAVSVIEKHRQEARVLRQDTAFAKLAKIRSKAETETWREKYLKSQEELKKAKQEIGKLRKEIEKITKTNNRYQVSLFDHGNFKTKAEPSEKKEKGGQLGHADTNRENQPGVESYAKFPRRRIYTKACAGCGRDLNRAGAVKQKVLLDIILNPALVKLVIESERQWCSNCHKEVCAKDEQTLPFTEYGLNTFMLVIILRFSGHLSMGSVSAVFKVAFGLTLSKSEVANLLKTAARYLGPKYQELLEAVRKGEVTYLDETGWQVKGQNGWMWIMTTEQGAGTEKNQKITLYYASESRGKGIAKELYGNSQAFAMTDGLDSYLKVISADKHLFCWAHVLRFSFEETVNSLPDSKSILLRDELVKVYHLKQHHPEYSKQELEDGLRDRLDALLRLTSDEESFLKIQHRLKDQKQGLILSLLLTKDGTNNLAERELRPMVLNKKVSFGSDTYRGMETTAILGSVIQTISRDPKLDVLTELELNLSIGIHQKYFQYKHLSFNST